MFVSSGARRDRAAVERRRLVEVATLARDAGERLDERRSGLSASARRNASRARAVVAEVEQQRCRDCPTRARSRAAPRPPGGRRRTASASRPPRAQRVAEVVPCARIAGVEPDGDRQRIDGPASSPHVGEQDAERVAQARIAGVAGDRVARGPRSRRRRLPSFPAPARAATAPHECPRAPRPPSRGRPTVPATLRAARPARSSASAFPIRASAIDGLACVGQHLGRPRRQRREVGALERARVRRHVGQRRCCEAGADARRARRA